MFCDQCEQAMNETRCASKIGVCGKNEDINSLQDTLIYGVKGVSAYAYHARELGVADEQVDAFIEKALFTTLTNVSFNPEQHLEMVLKCGEINLRIMELLDKAHTQKFGNPEPTSVMTGTVKGRGILISGHDLLDLYELLKQTEGTGINIYTHAEMLPAHAYPELKKFKHLAGNYGGAWQDQRNEFNSFSGPSLVTTNCILTPLTNTYLDRLFTTGVAGVPGATHIKNRDFSLVIEKAKSLPELPQKSTGTIMTGFHHTAILGLAGKIVELVKSGKIRRFFLIGGCDGSKPGRNYYTELAGKVPKDCVILTLACGKYRFNKLDFGEIEGIPRLIDIGQCNNAYSAIQVAAGLSKAFNCSVNDLPLSIVLSWFEQKAVAILLTLFYLGLKGIRIGPTAPAFISPGVLKIIQNKFDLKLITTAENDLSDILNRIGSKETARL